MQEAFDDVETRISTTRSCEWSRELVMCMLNRCDMEHDGQILMGIQHKMHGFVVIGKTLSKRGFNVPLKRARVITESQEYLLCNHVRSSLDGEGYRDSNLQIYELGLPNMKQVVSMSFCVRCIEQDFDGNGHPMRYIEHKQGCQDMRRNIQGHTLLSMRIVAPWLRSH